MHLYTAHIRDIRPKERARHFVKDGRIASYTPDATRQYEADIKQACALARGNSPMVRGWCVLGVAILDPVPERWSRARRARAVTQLEPAAARPDVDNVIKAAGDGPSGVWWQGDARVLPAPWRGWAPVPEQAGLHLAVWEAATPEDMLVVVTGGEFDRWVRELAFWARELERS